MTEAMQAAAFQGFLVGFVIPPLVKHAQLRGKYLRIKDSIFLGITTIFFVKSVFDHPTSMDNLWVAILGAAVAAGFVAWLMRAPLGEPVNFRFWRKKARPAISE